MDKILKLFLVGIMTSGSFTLQGSGLYANENMPVINGSGETDGINQGDELAKSQEEQDAISGEDADDTVPEMTGGASSTNGEETEVEKEETDKIESGSSNDLVPEVTEGVDQENENEGISDDVSGDFTPEISDKSSLNRIAPTYRNWDGCSGGALWGTVGPTTSKVAGVKELGPNPNETGKRSQDPNTDRVFSVLGDYNFYPYSQNEKLSEQDIIDIVWPHSDRFKSNKKLGDAVLEPSYACNYANPMNSWNKEVSQNDRGEKYVRYNADWSSNDGGTKHTPEAGILGNDGRLQSGGTSDTFVGNYTYHKLNDGPFPFRIVTRPSIELENRYIFYKGEGASSDWGLLPGVYDTTNGVSIPITRNNVNLRYKFIAKDGITSSDQENDYPTVIGKYDLTVEVAANKDKFRLPGFAKKEVHILPKGFNVKFTKKVDGIVSDMVDSDWNGSNDNPMNLYDKETMQKFGGEYKMYLENTNYTLPKPKYDDEYYIFEGYTIEEEYYDVNNREVKTRTISLNAENDFNTQINGYNYKTGTIGKGSYFLLNSKITANIRSRKRNNVTVVRKMLRAADPLVNDLTVNGNTTVNFQLREGKVTDFSLNASTSGSQLYDFVGWSTDPNWQPKYLPDGHMTTEGALSLDENFSYSTNVQNQNNIDVSTTIYAYFTTRKVDIVLNGNGGYIDITGLGKLDQLIQSGGPYNYNDVPKLEHNSFVREGYKFLGWSLQKEPNKSENQSWDDFKSKLQKPGDKFCSVGDGKCSENPDGVNTERYGILFQQGLDYAEQSQRHVYAIWERNTALVTAEKYRDTLFAADFASSGAEYTNFYVYGGPGNNIIQLYNAFEVARFYLNVELANGAQIEQRDLDRQNFRIVWERSTDGGNTWKKIEINEHNDGFVTRPFTFGANTHNEKDYTRVIYDEGVGQWFVPLLNLKRATSKGSIEGLYRVNVAYDDPDATDEIATEQEFYNGTKKDGWSTSNQIVEVKVSQSPEALIKVPAVINLTDGDDVSNSNNIIESVTKQNRVKVIKINHYDDPEDVYENGELVEDYGDYDWNTPDTMFQNGKPDDQFSAYTKQKPYIVEVIWDGTLRDDTGNYSINNIEMYSNVDMVTQNNQTISKNSIIPSGTKTTFSYDGQPTDGGDKILFDFYLKGNKPTSYLPPHTSFKGLMRFKVTTR